MAEEVVCKHREEISSNGKKGVCTLCGQKKQYDLIHPKEPPVVIKRGRINGVLTMIVPPGQEPEPVPAPVAAAVPESEVTVPPVPEEWSIMDRSEKHDWLQKHRARITSDLVSVGVVATGARWHLSSTTLYGLAKQWDIKPAKSGVKPGPKGGPKKVRVKAIRHGRKPKPTVDRHSSVEAKLPPFPPLNDSWSFNVQIAWFEAYIKLSNEEVRGDRA